MSADTMNMKALDGLRCLATIAVVTYHVFWILGHLFFLSTDPCLQAFRTIPFIGPVFFNISFQMTLFFCMSGFLCVHQLEKLKDRVERMGRAGGLQWMDCFKFLLNRVLRLYTYYALLLLISYCAESRCTIAELIKSIFFIMDFDPALGGPACVGHGWSMMVDVHGYLAIVACSLILPKPNVRKYLFLFCYALALLNLRTIKNKLKLSHLGGVDTAYYEQKFDQGGWVGLEFNLKLEDDILMNAIQLDVRKAVYPDVDFDNPLWTSLRAYRNAIATETYFTSIDKHGSAMFLGAFLYLHMAGAKRGQQDSDSVYSFAFKLLLIPLMFHVSNYWYGYSGVASCWIVYTVLTLPKQFSWMFANRIWSSLAPYTFGVYILHLFFAVGIAIPFHQNNANRLSENSADLSQVSSELTISFVLQTAVALLSASWFLAFVFFYTLEWPARFLRRRLMAPADEAKEPSKEN